MRPPSKEGLTVGDDCRQGDDCSQGDDESLYPTLEEIMSASLHEIDILRVLASLNGSMYELDPLDDRPTPERNEQLGQLDYFENGSPRPRSRSATCADSFIMISTAPSAVPSRRLSVPLSKQRRLTILPPQDDVQNDPVNLPLVEVSPGIFMKLRGSSESWQALQAGKVIITSCQVCDITLRCVEDAECVICPTCRVISPVQGVRSSQGGGGLGLGLLVDE
jgi:hypothetical protein